MSKEETKQKEDTKAPADFGFAQMGQMMNMCCTSEGGFPPCAAMTKPRRHPSRCAEHEGNSESEERKK